MSKKKLRTPLIKPRQQGGTFYTFASALEDVGLNINELKNKVSLSHYVLLNIPAFDSSIDFSFLGDANNGDYVFAQDFQSYVLNMETLLRNQDSYNFVDSLTVSERVFWKYLERTGVVNFVDDVDEDGNPTGFFVDSSNCVQAFGAITSGAQRTDSYGLYNETFVQIPSSYGKMKVLFKNVDDRNFYVNKFYTDSSSGLDNNLIEYIDENELDSSVDCVLHTGLYGTAYYDGIENGIGYYEISKNDHRACVEFSLSELRKYYKDDSLTYDDIAISHYIDSTPTDTILDSSSYYEFNAILVYYSIYDSTGKNIIATNAYGLLILDNAVSEGEKTYKFPVLVKKKSSLDDAGNSYSFRLNIKTTSVYNGDIIVTDNATAAFSMSEDFNDTIRNLADAIEILRSNANLIAVISSNNEDIKRLTMQSLDKIDDMEKTIKAMQSGKLKYVKASSVEASQLLVHTIDSSTIFVDTSSGATVGSAQGDTLSFNKVNVTNKLTASAARIDSLNVKELSFDDDNFIIKSSDGENIAYTKINESGLYTTGYIYAIDDTDEANTSEEVQETIDMNTAASLLENINVYADGKIQLPNKSKLEETIISSITDPTDQEIEKVNKHVESLYDNLKYQDKEGGDAYINMNALFGCLISQFTILRNEINELKLRPNN